MRKTFYSVMLIAFALFLFDLVMAISAIVQDLVANGITGLVLSAIGGAALVFLWRERSRILSN